MGMEMVEEERGSVDDDPVGPTELSVLVVTLTVGSTDPGPEVDVEGPWRARRESRRLWRTKEWWPESWEERKRKVGQASARSATQDRTRRDDLRNVASILTAAKTMSGKE